MKKVGCKIVCWEYHFYKEKYEKVLEEHMPNHKWLLSNGIISEFFFHGAFKCFPNFSTLSN